MQATLNNFRAKKISALQGSIRRKFAEFQAMLSTVETVTEQV